MAPKAHCRSHSAQFFIKARTLRVSSPSLTGVEKEEKGEGEGEQV